MALDPALPGVPHREVWLAEWTPRWAALFVEEAERLASALGPLAVAIEHYGSTSVPGLRAKPILDILVGAAGALAPRPFVSALAPLGYEYAPRAGVAHHLVFGKGIARTHLVHVVRHGGPEWRRALRFRDALRTDPGLAAAYAALKERLAARYRTDRAGYTDGKDNFIRQALGESSAP